MRTLFTLPILAFVSACGSPTTVDPTQVFFQRAMAADEMANFVLGPEDEETFERDSDLGLSKTSRSAMPTTGSAQFAGFAGLIIDPIEAEDDDDIVMLGDVTLTVTFAGTGTVTGTADDFVGVTFDGEAPRISQVSGSIEIGSNQSAILDGVVANEWEADYAGMLGFEGETYDISGELDGTFYGNRPGRPPETYIRATTGTDEFGLSLDSDGDDAPVTFEVIATNPG